MLLHSIAASLGHLIFYFITNSLLPAVEKLITVSPSELPPSFVFALANMMAFSVTSFLKLFL